MSQRNGHCYTEDELVRVAQRENNTKRSYLIVDPLQAKHVPVSPGRALRLFRALAQTFKEKYATEKLLLIGFAETATAIGAQAAITVDSYYMQTTREVLSGTEYLFFSEEHSHATEQKLAKKDLDEWLPLVDRIIFIEDEVTTGNTIWNAIHAIRRACPGHELRFSVASILNGMSGEQLARYRENDIPIHYLVKTDHGCYPEIAKQYCGDGEYVGCRLDNILDETNFAEITIKGMKNSRRLVAATDYVKACEQLWIGFQKEVLGVSGAELPINEIPSKIKHNRVHPQDLPSTGDYSHRSSSSPSPKARILVLGTEEFMYPALFIGEKLEAFGYEVYCHATTRSPIAVSTEDAYPLHTRYELKSLYDENRTTYLYDIDACDAVYIFTDASPSKKGKLSLWNALSGKNRRITLVRCIVDE